MPNKINLIKKSFLKAIKDEDFVGQSIVIIAISTICLAIAVKCYSDSDEETCIELKKELFYVLNRYPSDGVHIIRDGECYIKIPDANLSTKWVDEEKAQEIISNKIKGK